MLVVSFDDRSSFPIHFPYFILNTTAYCDLSFITPAKSPYKEIVRTSSSSEYNLHIVRPHDLPGYSAVRQLFDSNFENFSTNSCAFERACFHRWLAINAFTTNLEDSDYICLLDTDFLIGISPASILDLVIADTKNKDIQFIAEWDTLNPSAISPEITIMTKAFLFGFCEFLIANYFSPSMRSQLLTEYFERIGNGLEGGICDMRALASYVALRYSCHAYNLRSLKSATIIGNLNNFLDSELGRSHSWSIYFNQNKQFLAHSGTTLLLAGTHFQGSAKVYIPLAFTMNEVEGELNRTLCDQLLSSSYERNTSLLYLARRVIHKTVRVLQALTTYLSKPSRVSK